jgi:acyl transferase domain-containing protein
VHPLVGTRVDSMTTEICYEARYGVRHTDFLSDHKIAGTIVLPTTAELEAATIIGRTHFGSARISFDNAMHHEAMTFANGEDRTVRLVVTPHNSDRASFKLVSADSEESQDWRTHMSGTLRKSKVMPATGFSTAQIRARCQQTMSTADFYERLGELGLEYGRSFRGVCEMY